LAGQRGGLEIVSLDSMQVYRGMDIGTAKPTPAERAAVPHHLIDVADPADDWSVRATQDAARTAITQIEARGNRALLVGGTGLYVRAVVDDLAVPGTDGRVRAALEARVATDEGLRDAFTELQQRDPLAAARIEPGNRRRIVRALEVIDLTGRAFSSFGPGLGAYPPPVLDAALVGIDVPADDLRARIGTRFAAMRAAGLLDEVRALAVRPGGLSRTAAQAIGYKELLAYCAGDEPSLDAAFDRAVGRTRTFARRQRVWFRRDPRITWIPHGNIDELAALVLARWDATDRTATTP
jgi:tRNA dimethylallyltransferase